MGPVCGHILLVRICALSVLSGAGGGGWGLRAITSLFATIMLLLRGGGAACAKCLGPQPPAVVFTMCPSDGKAHDFGTAPGAKVESTDACTKCGKQRSEIDIECRECRAGHHTWVQDFEPTAPHAQAKPVVVATVDSKLTDPTLQSQPAVAHPVAQGTPVQLEAVVKCTRCGLRQRPGPEGTYMYGV